MSAVFVDYDNIYLSLKRKDEDAARRFAKGTQSWLKAIESGSLITSTTAGGEGTRRRIVASRCYGDPVPRRNARDNSTDMHSFTFVRHHFLRAGFEVIDCPPLTAQLKNSSDIRMVMDLRDFLTHSTHFDEFIILSGDADFTPVLHRLRAHARRTVIFANEHTAQPYTALCDGEIREQDLIDFLLREANQDSTPAPELTPPGTAANSAKSAPQTDIVEEIRGLVIDLVERTDKPVALEVLADRAQRVLGHERTVGTSWAGSGTFRGFLTDHLPSHIKITDQPPYMAYVTGQHDGERNGTAVGMTKSPAQQSPALAPAAEPSVFRPASPVPSVTGSLSGSHRSPASPPVSMPQVAAPPVMSSPRLADTSPHVASASLPRDGHLPVTEDLQPPRRPPLSQQPAAALQRSIARIHEACQAPPLAPPEYRLLFEMIAAELRESPLDGMRTAVNIVARMQQRGVDVKRDDIRFVLDVISEADPWFDQGVSANLFAGRFRNFVVARCRSQGLNLSADELDLIDAWFTSGGASASGQQRPAAAVQGTAGRGAADAEFHSDRHWEAQAQRSSTHQPSTYAAHSGGYPGGSGGSSDMLGHDVSSMPRIIRTRLPS